MNSDIRPPTMEDIAENEIKMLKEQLLSFKINISAAKANRNKLIEFQKNVELYIQILAKQTYQSEKRSGLLRDAENLIESSNKVLDLTKDLTNWDLIGYTNVFAHTADERGYILSKDAVDKVDNLGDKLIRRLEAIAKQGTWGQVFPFNKAPGSDYWGSAALRGGMPIRKKWVQINGHTYYHPSYASPKPWKIQARFSGEPGSGIWEKKPPYVHNRKPLEWSLGGGDVWAVSYEAISKALDSIGEPVLIEKLLSDLKASWEYAGGA